MIAVKLRNFSAVFTQKTLRKRIAMVVYCWFFLERALSFLYLPGFADESRPISVLRMSFRIFQMVWIKKGRDCSLCIPKAKSPVDVTRLEPWVLG